MKTMGQKLFTPFVCPLVLLTILLPAALPAEGESPKSFKSPEAAQAVQVYEKSVAAARAKLEMELATARQTLSTSLKASLEKATKAGDLDEALAIREFGRKLEEKVTPPAADKIQIIAAFYGQNMSWFDVTEKVRKATEGRSRWVTKVSSTDWGDPAPGFRGPRTLIIRYSFAGKAGYRTCYEGKGFAIP